MGFFKGFKKGIKEFGHIINILINTILLTIVYFIGVGSSSIIGSIFRKDFLDIKKQKNADTYWSDLNLKKEKIERYYRQF